MPGTIPLPSVGMDHEAGTAPSAVAQAAPGDVAESQSRQGIVTGTTQDCTDRLRAVLLGSELLHGPGSAQGVPRGHG